MCIYISPINILESVGSLLVCFSQTETTQRVKERGNEKKTYSGFRWKV